MSHFDKAFSWIIKTEGGYVNDPSDRGGETKYGIAKRTYPDLNIKALTKAQAREIYFQDYWTAARCDALPHPLSLAVFGGAVHHGPRKSIVLLQQTLGVKADGINGAITQKAAWRYESGWKVALADLLSRRAQFMHNIVLADASQAKFLRGWLKRLFDLQQFILE